MSKRQPSLSHHLDKIAQTELVAKVPAHTKNDYVAVKVTAGEQPVQTPQFAHHGPSNRSARHSNRIVDPYLHHSLKHQGQPPETITLDGYAASHRAVREMKADGLVPEETKVRSSKYLNNLIEQDHRNIKSRTNVMLGFKRFRSAAITISGIELMHRIRKGQFGLARLRLEDTTAPAVWNAVLTTQ